MPSLVLEPKGNRQGDDCCRLGKLDLADLRDETRLHGLRQSIGIGLDHSTVAVDLDPKRHRPRQRWIVTQRDLVAPICLRGPCAHCLLKCFQMCAATGLMFRTICALGRLRLRARRRSRARVF